MKRTVRSALRSLFRSSLLHCGAMVALLVPACTANERKSPAPVASSPSPIPSAEPVPACPTEMARIVANCIDRWEAHLVVADSGARHPGNHRPKPSVRYAARSAPGVNPQGYLNRLEAAAACEAAGKRLCTARQWLDACKGPNGTDYPYGDVPIAGRCNTHKGHVPVKVFGRNTTLNVAHFNDPRLHDEPGFLARTGEFVDCRTEAGVFDMVGNLHEWVADDVSNALTERIPLAYGKHMLGPRGNGVFMGGYFSSNGEHGKGCIYTTTSHVPDYHDYSIGFRCCRDAR